MPELELLTFDEFTHRDIIPKYDNFPLHFHAESDPSYRKKPVFQRFLEAHPRLEVKLRVSITETFKSGLSSERLRPFDADLYVAYCLMRSDGASDGDLFT